MPKIQFTKRAIPVFSLFFLFFFHSYLTGSLVLGFWGRHSHEALGKEFILLLPGLLGCNLSHHLLPAGTSPIGKFAHVLTISLALFLLGIDAARLELSGGRDGRTAEEGSGGKGLQIVTWHHHMREREASYECQT